MFLLLIFLRGKKGKKDVVGMCKPPAEGRV